MMSASSPIRALRPGHFPSRPRSRLPWRYRVRRSPQILPAGRSGVPVAGNDLLLATIKLFASSRMGGTPIPPPMRKARLPAALSSGKPLSKGPTMEGHPPPSSGRTALSPYFSRHPVARPAGRRLPVDLADADGAWQKFCPVICIHGDKLPGPRLPASV